MDLSKIKYVMGCAVLGLAGLLYLNQPEKPKQTEIEQSKPMSVSQDASGLINRCMKRMEDAGAKLRHDETHATWQFHILLDYADANKDNRIDRAEAEELCSYWLNPETPGGRLALPYSGPAVEDNNEDDTKRFVDNINQFPLETRLLFKRNMTYVMSLVDENLDEKVSGAEVSRALYKMQR